MENVRATRRRGLSCIALVLLGAVMACGGPTSTLPPESSPPDVVLYAYLRALVAGDCAAARALTNPTFQVGNGELCGHTKVIAFRVDDNPAFPGSEVVFATTLTTTGTSDGSVPPGELTWFYSLDRTHGNVWRLVGGGTGP